MSDSLLNMDHLPMIRDLKFSNVVGRNYSEEYSTLSANSSFLHSFSSCDENLRAHFKSLFHSVHDLGESMQDKLYDKDDRGNKPLRYGMKYKDVRYRVQRHKADTGHYYHLRRLGSKPPFVHNLAFPEFWPEFYLNPALREGGLILIGGPQGQGKTTTTSAINVSRLHEFGGESLTVEDPPEYLMQGQWDKGWCTQTPVDEMGYGPSIEAALRSFSSVPNKIFVLGELINAEAASHCIEQANNGLLVLATLHGFDLSSMLNRFISMASARMPVEVAARLLATSLRLATIQNVSWHPKKSGWDAGTFSGDLLYVNDQASGHIENRRFSDVDKLIMRQKDVLNRLAKTNDERRARNDSNLLGLNDAIRELSDDKS